jgi:hypothetical protein
VPHLAGFDLSLTGFGDLELGSLLADKTEGLTDPDDAPPVPEQKGTASRQQTQELAAIIHLCGAGRPNTSLRRAGARTRERLQGAWLVRRSIGLTVQPPQYGINAAQ